MTLMRISSLFDLKWKVFAPSKAGVGRRDTTALSSNTGILIREILAERAARDSQVADEAVDWPVGCIPESYYGF